MWKGRPQQRWLYTDCKLGLVPEKDTKKVRAEQDEDIIVEDVALVTKVIILFTVPFYGVPHLIS